MSSIPPLLKQSKPLQLNFKPFSALVISTVKSSSMAFKKTLAQRLFNICRIPNPSLSNCRTNSSSTAAKALAAPNPDKIAPDPGDDGMFRRFLHRQPLYPSSAAGRAPEFRSFPMGAGLMEKLREMDIARNRIRLDVLSPPAEVRSEDEEVKLTAADARKLFKLSQLQMVKARLRQTEKNCVSHAEFVEICAEACGNRDQGKELAKMLDESGTVIVLGDIVFLRPEQVMKAIQGLMPVRPMGHPSDARLKELEAMEKQKAEIDNKADSLVRRELLGGLGYLVIQTAALMRLTFWELTWDVMEPICFYLTSMYFMAGYAFFLRTSKEPSFEGFYQSRFCAKQKRLMKLHNFNLERYNELRRIYYPQSALPPPVDDLSFTSWYDNAVNKAHAQEPDVQKVH